MAGRWVPMPWDSPGEYCVEQPARQVNCLFKGRDRTRSIRGTVRVTSAPRGDIRNSKVRRQHEPTMSGTGVQSDP